VAAGNEMRVSDAEREAAAAELREHFASGRLNQDELDERLTSAFAATTRADLNALFTDLPSSGPGWAAASGPGAGSGFSGSGFSGAPGWGARDDAYAGAQARGACGGAMGRGIGRLVFSGVLVPLLLLVGILGIFGIGTGRPFGVVLVLAALALLRRLVFMILGRRGGGRGGRGRGGRGRRR
jgi:hypothetical protein